ncbi:MAG TPA: VWA domain-containing protein [Candidatus Polarisedimenticolia bacterium]|nr:VWA domain-containing protein [Candidatus Polarisedimenticolia bacterium]
MTFSRLSLAPLILAAATSSVPSNETSRVEVSLILLDVVVTDRKGNHVGGLAREDFDLIVDNVRTPLEAVEDRCVADGATLGADGRRSLIVLFDLSHMLLTARNDAIRAAIRYVEDEMEQGERMMVLAFMNGLHIVSPMTEDRAELGSRLRRLLDDRSMVDPVPFEEENRIQQIGRSAMRRFRAQQWSQVGFTQVPDVGCETDVLQAEYRAARTLRTLANAMPAFGALPGRKAFILFTETLRSREGPIMGSLCNTRLSEGPGAGLLARPELEDLQRRANLAGVSLYTVHAGGMGTGVSDPLWEAAQDLQVSLALATGGRQLVLMKERTLPFRQALQDLSCHYVLAWRPPEGMKQGRHAVLVRSHKRGLSVRHREYILVQSRAEAADNEMLAVLSNPGLYKDLPVQVHGYSLSSTVPSRRAFLLRASVEQSLLAGAPTSATAVNRMVQLRGAVLAPGGDVDCRFERTIPVEMARDQDAAGDAGVEVLCHLKEGEHEMVVAARDENGGALGAYWGRLTVKPPEEHSGMKALLWTPAGRSVWHRLSDDPWLPSAGESLAVDTDNKITAREKAVVTFLLCSRKGAAPRELKASLLLDGPERIRLHARPAATEQKGRCLLMRADLAAGALAPGLYEVVPEPPEGWTAVGARTTLQVVDDHAEAPGQRSSSTSASRASAKPGSSASASRKEAAASPRRPARICIVPRSYSSVGSIPR